MVRERQRSSPLRARFQQVKIRFVWFDPSHDGRSSKVHADHTRVWDKPASACLSSRVPYGSQITMEKLSTIDRGEQFLHELGFRVCRVRHHGDIARIEIAADELPRALDPEMAARMAAAFKALGFKYVALDLEGYRTGAMNEALKK